MSVGPGGGDKSVAGSVKEAAHKASQPQQKSTNSLLKERFKPQQRRNINHPDVDPTKLTKQQAVAIADYISQIQQLEGEYDTLKNQKLKLKEQ